LASITVVRNQAKIWDGWQLEQFIEINGVERKIMHAKDNIEDELQL